MKKFRLNGIIALASSTLLISANTLANPTGALSAEAASILTRKAPEFLIRGSQRLANSYYGKKTLSYFGKKAIKESFEEHIIEPATETLAKTLETHHDFLQPEELEERKLGGLFNHHLTSYSQPRWTPTHGLSPEKLVHSTGYFNKPAYISSQFSMIPASLLNRSKVIR